MAFKLIWSPSARLDIKDIVAFIAENSKTAPDMMHRVPATIHRDLCDALGMDPDEKLRAARM